MLYEWFPTQINNKMKKICLIAAIVLYCKVSCQSQQLIINDKELTTMKTFDIEQFNRYAENGIYEFHLKDDLFVTQRKMDDYYFETIVKKDTPLQKNNAYYLSGIIKYEANYFYNCLIGISKHYDPSGKLIKEIDEDAPYKFSLEDLIKMVKEEYHIDLMKPRPRMSITRGTDYGVSFGYGPGENPWSREMINVSGETGKVYFHQDRHGSVLLDEDPSGSTKKKK